MHTMLVSCCQSLFHTSDLVYASRRGSWTEMEDPVEEFTAAAEGEERFMRHELFWSP